MTLPMIDPKSIHIPHLFGWHQHSIRKSLVWVGFRGASGMGWGFEDTGLLLAPPAANLTPCTPAADDPRLNWFRENLHLFPPEFQPTIPEAPIGRGDWVECEGEPRLVVSEMHGEVGLGYHTRPDAMGWSRNELTRTADRPDNWAEIEKRWGITR